MSTRRHDGFNIVLCPIMVSDQNHSQRPLFYQIALLSGIANITLDIQPGKLCSIVGVVGSGKSSLLQAILGELELDEGSLAVNGSISYAPQEPWLFEGTVRQNIVFISEYDEKRYSLIGQ